MYKSPPKMEAFIAICMFLTLCRAAVHLRPMRTIVNVQSMHMMSTAVATAKLGHDVETVLWRARLDLSKGKV